MYSHTYMHTYTHTCTYHNREEAELEYLRVAQDLEMYGVNYFDVKVGSRTFYNSHARNFYLCLVISLVFTAEQEGHPTVVGSGCIWPEHL